VQIVEALQSHTCELQKAQLQLQRAHEQKTAQQLCQHNALSLKEQPNLLQQAQMMYSSQALQNAKTQAFDIILKLGFEDV